MSGLFDRFAALVAGQVARAWFFALCVLLVIVWAPSLPVFGNVDTWQLVINTATTIVTFLLVALLQNTQDRSTRALQHKNDAIIGGLVLLLEDLPGVGPDHETVRQLREMAGTEMEST